MSLFSNRNDLKYHFFLVQTVHQSLKNLHIWATAKTLSRAMIPFSTDWCLCFSVHPAYQIAYRKNSSSITSATVDVLNPSARQYTATGLKQESVYVFRLTAQTRKGWGEAAEALVVTTEKRGMTSAQLIRLLSFIPYVWLTLLIWSLLSSPTAHESSSCTSGRSPGSQCAVVMGTG